MIVLPRAIRPPEFEPRPLRFVVLLDPRPEATARSAPLADAVNIPADQLEVRVAELPPRNACVAVADLPGCDRLLRGMEALGRSAARYEEFSYARKWDSGEARLWRPSPWIEQHAAALQPGVALDPACGMGRDAVFLASLGWNVWANDILPDAVERGQALEARHAAFVNPIQWTIGDAAAIIEQVTPAPNLMICVRFLDRALLADTRNRLPAGASLMLETFTSLHRARHGKPRTERFVLTPGELREILADWEIRAYDESWQDEAHLARVWAVNPSQR